MKRFWYLWIPFGAFLAVVLTAMGWISFTALELDRAEAEAQRRATLEENVRLALWRMDSAVSPILARENARPYFSYGAFLPIGRAYGRMFNDSNGRNGEPLLPSPLLTENPPNVLVYFQFEPDGALTSPQLPAGRDSKLPLPAGVDERDVDRARRQLDRVAKLTDAAQLAALLPERPPATSEAVVARPSDDVRQADQVPQQPSANSQAAAQSQSGQIAQQAARPMQRGQRAPFNERQQIEYGRQEYLQRRQAVDNSANTLAQQTISNANTFAMNGVGAAPDGLPLTDVRGVPMAPLWIDGQLILARRVVVAGEEYVQGLLLDWPAIRRWLTDTVQDLLPEAQLEPVANAPLREEARLLASLPVRLAPGTIPAEPTAWWSPIRLSLLAAWSCVLLATLAVAALLSGAIRLNERRAAFVTAVTHELRTPLTTFHMYTEMLAEGMVPDPARQREYLQTLRSEASRLSHLVENVLAYARLERGRADGRIESLAVDQLLAPIRGRLAQRAAQAGMELVFDCQGDLQATVRANPSAVEQILFNLVDNSCKYAISSEDKRIHLDATRNDGVVELRVRDHGPGISPAASRRLFRSFSKSAQEAARSAPGVGLGLALSRRLARDMGGKLVAEQNGGEGACFVLRLAGE